MKVVGCMKTNRQRRLSSGAQGGPLGKKCAALVNSGKIWFMITFLDQNPSPAGEGSDEAERERDGEGEGEKERDAHAI